MEPTRPAADPERPRTPAERLAELSITRWDVLCVGPIVLSSIYGLVGSPITPSLIGTHPVLLAFLRGSIPAMISCGSYASIGRIPLWQAILAPLPILTWVDPFFYWAGRRYGRAILDYYAGQSDRMRRRVAQGERWFARYGVWGILFSCFNPLSVVFFIAAGESRMNFWKFLAADIAGNLLWIGGVVSLGWYVGGKRGVDLAETISHYGLWLTIAMVVGVAVIVVRQTRANMRAMSSRRD